VVFGVFAAHFGGEIEWIVQPRPGYLMLNVEPVPGKKFYHQFRAYSVKKPLEFPHKTSKTPKLAAKLHLKRRNSPPNCRKNAKTPAFVTRHLEQLEPLAGEVFHWGLGFLPTLWFRINSWLVQELSQRLVFEHRYAHFAVAPETLLPQFVIVPVHN